MNARVSLVVVAIVTCLLSSAPVALVSARGGDLEFVEAILEQCHENDWDGAGAGTIICIVNHVLFAKLCFQILIDVTQRNMIFGTV